MIRKIRLTREWDVIVIGGGATGLWCALDAVTRGYKTLLLERDDFTSCTSSKSTKLFHGGIRYLKQGHIELVREALIERGRLAKNAPHLFLSRPFLIPYFRGWEKYFYNIGMFIYDFLAGELGLEKHKVLLKDECLEKCPTILKERLKGGLLFYDGQFDDSRFAIELAKTIVEHEGTVLNHAEVHAFIKQSGKISGVCMLDHNSGEFFELRASNIINASGIFVDEIRKMDDPRSTPIMSFSRGSHIIVDQSFLPGDTALIIPKTEDKRLIFLIPWQGVLLIGTTDIPVEKVSYEDTVATDAEIDFLLLTAGKYLQKKPTREDILSTFAGLRPLVKSKEGKTTSKLSRTHKILVSESGLITIAGGKWTTARKMAEDTIDRLGKRECMTKTLPVHQTKSFETHIPLHKDLPYTREDIIRAIQEELALTLTDVLARRTRAILLNAKVALEIAPKVASIMAEEMNKDNHWIKKQYSEFATFATNYLPAFLVDENLRFK